MDNETEDRKKVEEVLGIFHKLMMRSVQLENEPKMFDTGMLLYRGEIHTVQAIGKSPDMNMKALADAMGVTKGAVSQMVTKLVKKGLVSKVKDTQNAKEIRLGLTELGWKGFHAHEAFHEEMFKIFDDYFGDELAGKMEGYKGMMGELLEIADLFEERTKDL